MCYTGKCIYENGMGDCNAPDGLENACYKGHKYSRKESRKIHFKYIIKHNFKYIFSKKYREEYKNLPF